MSQATHVAVLRAKRPLFLSTLDEALQPENKGARAKVLPAGQESQAEWVVFEGALLVDRAEKEPAGVIEVVALASATGKQVGTDGKWETADYGTIVFRLDGSEAVQIGLAPASTWSWTELYDKYGK